MNQGLFGFPAAHRIKDIEALLAADVTMPATNTYYDGPSMMLPPGRWYIVSVITVHSGATSAANFQAKLWNGTTAIGSGGAQAPQANSEMQLRCEGFRTITAVAGEVWKVSAANSTNTTGKIKAAVSSNGAGNNASSIRAILLSKP